MAALPLTRKVRRSPGFKEYFTRSAADIPIKRSPSDAIAPVVETSARRSTTVGRPAPVRPLNPFCASTTRLPKGVELHPSGRSSGRSPIAPPRTPKPCAGSSTHSWPLSRTSSRSSRHSEERAPAPEEMLTIEPLLRSSVPGKSAAVRRTAERKFGLRRAELPVALRAYQ